MPVLTQRTTSSTQSGTHRYDLSAWTRMRRATNLCDVACHLAESACSFSEVYYVILDVVSSLSDDSMGPESIMGTSGVISSNSASKIIHRCIAIYRSHSWELILQKIKSGCASLPDYVVIRRQMTRRCATICQDLRTPSLSMPHRSHDAGFGVIAPTCSIGTHT
jgi:hypothetical protein